MTKKNGNTPLSLSHYHLTVAIEWQRESRRGEKKNRFRDLLVVRYTDDTIFAGDEEGRIHIVGAAFQFAQQFRFVHRTKSIVCISRSWFYLGCHSSTSSSSSSSSLTHTENSIFSLSFFYFDAGVVFQFCLRFASIELQLEIYLFSRDSRPTEIPKFQSVSLVVAVFAVMRFNFYGRALCFGRIWWHNENALTFTAKWNKHQPIGCMSIYAIFTTAKHIIHHKNNQTTYVSNWAAFPNVKDEHIHIQLNGQPECTLNNSLSRDEFMRWFGVNGQGLAMTNVLFANSLQIF